MKTQNIKIEKGEYLVRLSVILLALLTPYIFLLTEGYLPSLSSYWRTPVQPLFIIANASTSYFFFSSHSTWKIPAVCLLILTAFSVEDFPITHNISAVFFFLSCLIPLYLSNRLKIFLWLYISSTILMPFSMTLGECISITILCIYHFITLNKVYKISKKNNLKFGN